MGHVLSLCVLCTFDKTMQYNTLIHFTYIHTYINNNGLIKHAMTQYKKRFLLNFVLLFEFGHLC